MSAAGTLPELTSAERKAFEARGWTFTETATGCTATNEQRTATITAGSIEEVAEKILNHEYERERVENEFVVDTDKLDAEAAAGSIEAIAGDAMLDDDEFDLVPDDPHGRNWSSLSDWELSKWHKQHSGEVEHAETLKRCEAEMNLRDAVEGLHQRIAGVDDATLEGAAILYKDEPRLLEIVHAEYKRRHPLVTIHAADELKPETRRAIEKAASTVVEQLSLFDYAQLDESTAIVCRGAAAEIREHTQSIKNSTELIGRRLREVKASLKRGQFDAWLKAETIFSRDTADRLIAIAEWAEQSPQFAANQNQFQKSAAYLLVAGGASESARVEAAARAEAGEKITKQAAQEIVKAHKPRVAKMRDIIPGENQATPQVGVARSQENPQPAPFGVLSNPSDEPESVDLSPEPAADATVAGVCRVCGCTHTTPCENDLGLACGWLNDEQTLCSNCAELMEERGLDEATLHARLQSDSLKTSNDLSAASNDGKSVKYVPPSPAVGAADVEAVAEPVETALAQSDASEAERAAWNAALIKINILLFRHDGDPAGRRVQIGVAADEGIPTFTGGRESEVFKFMPTDPLGPRAALRLYDLPSVIAEPLLKLATGLQAKIADDVKAAAASAKPATSSKPAKKAVAKQAAPAKKAAAKTASKKKGGG